MSEVCKNCGESIELVNYTLGLEWMHNPPGYTGHKMGGGAYNVFRHCRTAVAEPVVGSVGGYPNQEGGNG